MGRKYHLYSTIRRERPALPRPRPARIRGIFQHRAKTVEVRTAPAFISKLMKPDVFPIFVVGSLGNSNDYYAMVSKISGGLAADWCGGF
jgi:hypothetical protein